MKNKVEVSLPAFVVCISLLVLVLLFWLFYRNANHISSVLDQKLSLEHSVEVLAQLIGATATQCAAAGIPDTSKGDVLTPETCPLLFSLLGSIEQLKLINNKKVYVFIIDSSGNQVVNGGSPSLAVSKNGGRPGTNTLQYTDSNGNQVTKMILDKGAAGGGYVEYMWPDPVTRENAKKLAYVKQVPNTPWTLGAGLYL